jgi:hypothetical protein
LTPYTPHNTLLYANTGDIIPGIIFSRYSAAGMLLHPQKYGFLAMQALTLQRVRFFPTLAGNATIYTFFKAFLCKQEIFRQLLGILGYESPWKN